MRFGKFLLSFPLLAALSLVVLVTGCNTDDCKDEICAPCPSSRFVVAYQDSLGNCVPGFHSSARVYAISAENPTDTAYTYSFSDSCQVGFLINEDMVYHLRGSNPTVHDIISFSGFEYQDPLYVTECCLCYPVSHVDVRINGTDEHVEFPTGEYQNDAFVRRLN